MTTRADVTTPREVIAAAPRRRRVGVAVELPGTRGRPVMTKVRERSLPWWILNWVIAAAVLVFALASGDLWPWAIPLATSVGFGAHGIYHEASRRHQWSKAPTTWIEPDTTGVDWVAAAEHETTVTGFGTIDAIAPLGKNPHHCQKCRRRFVDEARQAQKVRLQARKDNTP